MRRREREQRVAERQQRVEASGRYRVEYRISLAPIRCQDCGAQVMDTDAHDRWHAAYPAPH